MQQIYYYDCLFKRKEFRNLERMKEFTRLGEKEKAQVRWRIKVIEFFDNHGAELTKEAYGVGRSTVYLWKKRLKKGRGRLSSLLPYSRAPMRKRCRKVHPEIREFIIRYRQKHPRVGQDVIKPALDKYCRKMKIKSISKATIGRVIADLKKEGKIKDGKVEVRLDARTGKLHEKKKKREKKLRRKDYQPRIQGDLVQMDSISKFRDGVKRYIITALDLKTRMGFAWGYTSLSSRNARDFMQKIKEVFPFEIKRVQTDNGSEFEKHFREYVRAEGIVQFFNYPKRPMSNAHVERFNRTVKEQFVNYNTEIFEDIDEFNSKLVDYLLWYNTEKPHRGINGLTPMDFLVKNFVKKSNMYGDPTMN